MSRDGSLEAKPCSLYIADNLGFLDSPLAPYDRHGCPAGHLELPRLLLASA